MSNPNCIPTTSAVDSSTIKKSPQIQVFNSDASMQSTKTEGSAHDFQEMKDKDGDEYSSPINSTINSINCSVISSQGVEASTNPSNLNSQQSSHSLVKNSSLLTSPLHPQSFNSNPTSGQSKNLDYSISSLSRSLANNHVSHSKKRGRLPQSQHIQMRRSPFVQNQPNQFQQLDPPSLSSSKVQTYFDVFNSTIESSNHPLLSTPEAKIYYSTPSTPKSPLASLRNRIKEGNQLFKSEKFQEAIEVWMTALSDVPHHKGLLHNVATAYEQLGQKEKTILWLRKSAELDNVASMMALGKALMNFDSLGKKESIFLKTDFMVQNDSMNENNQRGDDQKVQSEDQPRTIHNTSHADDSEELEEAPNVNLDESLIVKRVTSKISMHTRDEDSEDAYSTSTEDDESQQEDDYKLEAIKWFQKIIRHCGGKIESTETHNTNVQMWYDKARSLFEKFMSHISQGDYHYHENDDTILFSPSSPFKKNRILTY